MRMIGPIVMMAVVSSCAAPEPPGILRSPLNEPETANPLELPPRVTAAVSEPDGVTLGGARIIGTSRGAAHVSVIPLAPEHVGLTGSSQPVLYWYLSQAVSSPVVFVLIDTRTVQVLHDVKMAPPFAPGLQAIPLREHGISLEIDVPYRWYIDLVVDDESPSRDIVSGGMIRRVRTAVDVSGLAPSAEAVRVYADTGLWYDAIAAISQLIAAAPDDRLLHAQRASLLRQIGLSDVADWDLQRSGRN
jgi:Domain of Unknown Function (DUF928)